jgi:hypothetical protein
MPCLDPVSAGAYTPRLIAEQLAHSGSDIGQNALLKEPHFVHDVRDSIEDFERSLDNGVGIEPGMFD